MCGLCEWWWWELNEREKERKGDIMSVFYGKNNHIFIFPWCHDDSVLRLKMSFTRISNVYVIFWRGTQEEPVCGCVSCLSCLRFRPVKLSSKNVSPKIASQNGLLRLSPMWDFCVSLTETQTQLRKNREKIMVLVRQISSCSLSPVSENAIKRQSPQQEREGNQTSKGNFQKTQQQQPKTDWRRMVSRAERGNS